VAGLAVAANLLTQHEIAVVNTTRIVPMAVAPALESSRPAAAASAATSTIESQGLITAVEQYEDAVRSHALVHNEDSDDRFDDATRALRRQTQVFASQAPGTISATTLRTLSERLATYNSHGDELSHIADVRQDQFAEISSHLESLDAHLQSSIDRAWKILGRVIARKSLMDLKSELDDVRRQFASLPPTEDFNIEALAGLTTSESVLEDTLEKSARDLAQSQGEPWVSQMRSQLAGLHDLQAALTESDEQRHSSLESLGRESEGLITFVRSIKPIRPSATALSPPTGRQTGRSVALDHRALVRAHHSKHIHIVHPKSACSLDRLDQRRRTRVDVNRVDLDRDEYRRPGAAHSIGNPPAGSGRNRRQGATRRNTGTRRSGRIIQSDGRTA
jgi:hypothetical protein